MHNQPHAQQMNARNVHLGDSHCVCSFVEHESNYCEVEAPFKTGSKESDQGINHVDASDLLPIVQDSVL